MKNKNKKFSTKFMMGGEKLKQFSPRKEDKK